MKLSIYLIAFLFFLPAFGQERWLTKISSHYTDLATQKKLKIEGTGFLVACVGCREQNSIHPQLFRYFVFTASHVSQGNNLEIQLAKKKIKLEAVGRLADNLHDVEVFEVAGELISPDDLLATYISPQNEVFTSFRWNPSDGRLFLTGAARNHFSFAYKKSAWRFLSPEVFFVDRAREPFTENSFIPVAPWVNGKLKEPDTNEFSRYSVSHVPFGNELIANASIAKGMSGSPLIRAYNIAIDSNMVIDGIVSRKLRGFDQAYFISNAQMDSVFKNYMRGQRGLLDDVRWNVANGITFRTLDDGTREIVDLKLPTGNGLSGDGGDTANFNSLTSEPMGMIWKGHLVAGFYLHCEINQKAYNFSIYANLAVIDFFKKFQKICQAQPLASQDLDREKLTRAGLDVNMPLSPLVQINNEIVDIHELFFVDLSMFAIPMEDAIVWNEENILKKLVERSNQPRVRRQIF